MAAAARACGAGVAVPAVDLAVAAATAAVVTEVTVVTKVAAGAACAVTKPCRKARARPPVSRTNCRRVVVSWVIGFYSLSDTLGLDMFANINNSKSMNKKVINRDKRFRLLSF